MANTSPKFRNAIEGNLVIVSGLYTSHRNKYGDPQIMSPALASSSLDSAESKDSDDFSNSDDGNDDDGDEDGDTLEEDDEDDADTDDYAIQETVHPQGGKQQAPYNTVTPGKGCHLTYTLSLLFKPFNV